MWAKFDITGFKYGEKNHIDVSYVTSVDLAERQSAVDAARAGGGTEREFLSQTLRRGVDGDQPAAEHQPGEFTIAVTVKDAVGKQTYETKQTFTVE